MKKVEDPAFAAGVDRDEVTDGARGPGVDLKEHIQFVIGTMRGSMPELGLEGEKRPNAGDISSVDGSRPVSVAGICY